MSGLPAVKKKIIACVVCGKPVSEMSERFCSNRCRNIYIHRRNFIESLEGAKTLDSLDSKLRYCKEIGITYAEYQQLETLGKIK